MHADQRIVAVYECDREYGGPEEGGWWFESGELVHKITVPAGEVRQVIARLKQTYPYTGKRGSVNYSGGDYSIEVWDEQPPVRFPKERPYYC